MTNPETATVFAGLDGRTDAALPAWYARQKSTDDLVSFAEAIRQLPKAVETQVAYRNPYSDTWVDTDRFNAIVEPGRLAAQGEDENEEDPLFHIPTESYAIINPLDVYGPLESVLRKETVDGEDLGEVVFGEIRQYRGGGEVHMDVLFDGLAITLPDRDEPITMGMSSGYDFFGGHAVYVEGYAQDNYCSNSMRSLTDRESIKHVGAVGDFEEWWHRILSQMELIADDLLAFIEEAQDITVDLTQVPFDLPEFYSLLGLPDYLATQAASDAQANANDPFEVDMWTLHSGATHALTHFYRGKEGASLDSYVQIANDVLFNPESILRRVTQAYEERARSETDRNGQTGLESQAALAQITQVEADIHEKAATFREREETLRERFAETGD